MTANKPINNIVPILLKSVFVLYPIIPNSPNTKAAIKNTIITESSSNKTKILENVKPVTNEYNKKHILAVVGLIFLTLIEKNITNANSAIINTQYNELLNTASNIVSLIDTT